MPAVLWKAIKPGRFNDKVFNQYLKQENAKVADEVLLDFLLTVSKWDREPKFEKLIQVGPDGVGFLVGTDDQIYKWVSGGTKDHRVPKEGTATMVFQPLYTAKTAPGVISSRTGGASGPVVIRRGAWTVKGIKPRNFEETIEKKWRPKHKRRMQGAMSKAAKVSGHGIK